MKRHEIDNLIGNYDVLLKDRQVLIDCLRNAIDRFKTQPQNRDGRGIKHCVRKRLCKSVRRLGFLLHLSSEHPDPQIRYRVNKLLRSIPHHNGFSTLERQTASLVAKALEASRRLQLQADGRTIAVTRSLQLEEVRTCSMLQQVGAHLRLCVRHPSEAHRHFDQVLYGKMELWVVKRAEKIVGLMRVDIEYKRDDWGYVGEPPHEPSDYSRQIADCESFDNKDLRLSHRIALEIVKCLQIDQVYAWTFSQIGAYPMFLLEEIKQPIPEPLFDGTEWHYVWRTTYHMVIASAKKKLAELNRFNYSKMKWSYFQSEPNNDWADPCLSNYLHTGDLLKLILNCPNMNRITNDIRGDVEDLEVASEWI
ncbi:MAG: hypothetical protein F4227_02030 [Gammaproteobacteria bacterium]|nr:hypothetical protein [Gammaproteobacteria bacterium]MYF01780.1 hypothetical protein [Gammaproteobacteria bacterium]MYI76207.1 hypothetical protein [Gammaproteobacteria bacterium]